EIKASGYNEPQPTVLTPGTPGSGGTTSTVTQDYNGHTYTYTTTSYSSPGTSGTYTTVPHGIWIDGAHQATFKVLQCPSDPTSSANGLVYEYWGYTNYEANWNAWGDGKQGLWTPQSRFAAIKDGLSNTVLFGDAYANCDGLGRIALYSWYYQTFGLDWYQLPNTWMFQVRPGEGKCDDCCNNWRTQTGHEVMNVTLGDGSVRSLSGNIQQEVWDRLLLPR